jgi:ribosome-binding protein aMBF1 (putative translation factor)
MTEISNTSNPPDASNSPEKQKPTPNQRLRRERERRAWSQQELADEVGTTPLNVGRWERGVTQPIGYN